MTADGHRCEPVVDDDGTVLGHARVSPSMSDEGRRALAALVRAVGAQMAAGDAADPEAAVERACRQEAGRARIAERMLRYRGEAE
jgi:hypothetical protein